MVVVIPNGATSAWSDSIQPALRRGVGANELEAGGEAR
jgi:hypothetical protein